MGGAMADTDWAMEDTAMAVMAMARGLLMLMPSTAMEDMVLAFMESLPHAWTPLTSQSHAPMARGLLIPMPTTVMVELTPDTDMAVLAMAMAVLAMAMANKFHHDVQS